MRLLLLFILILNLLYSQKIALVIGNKNYTNHVGLNNPISDAKLIKNRLESMDFFVMKAYNKNLNSLSDILDEFISKARKADVAVIYYAGHGIGVGDKNYLIPLGASNLSIDNIGRKLMSVDELKGAVASAKGFGVIFFDACRNSLFGGSIRGLTSRGSRALVRPTVRRGQNILLSFSTKAGTRAKDDVNGGRHSPYALALDEYLNAPIDIRRLMGSVRSRVSTLTKYQQTPIDENQLDGKEYRLNRVDIVKKYSLTINPTPSNAKVYIMNIKTKYKDGIRLKKGWYEIKVKKQGYETKLFKVNLNRDRDYDIRLTELKNREIVIRENKIKKITETIVVQPKKPLPTKYSLSIKPAPSNAKVYITNIKPRYRDGIRLKEGRYKIKVVAKGYKKKILNIYLKKDNVYKVELAKFKVVKKSKTTKKNKVIYSSNSKWLRPSKRLCKSKGAYLKGRNCKANWLIAKKICSSMGGRLPTLNELVAEKNSYKKHGFSSSWFYWTSSTLGSNKISVMDFGSKLSGFNISSSNCYVICTH